MKLHFVTGKHLARHQNDDVAFGRDDAVFLVNFDTIGTYDATRSDGYDVTFKKGAVQVPAHTDGFGIVKHLFIEGWTQPCVVVFK